MRRFARVVILLLIVIIPACGGGDETASGDTAITDAERIAQHATQELTTTLLGEVQRAMKEGGPILAVRQCTGLAQELTDKVAAEHGVRMRRVTEKPRNPLDSPDAYERRILARFEADLAAGSMGATTTHAEVVQLEGKRALRFLKPITIKKPCLSCHGTGDQVSPEVAQEIRERYPGDQAMDYREGDLRGAISVIVPLSE
ncbi:MAG: DUF3365 domain-containing protein [Bacteroidetes bacterium]|nr:DUF3365 domain-containing protein [Bacteroidota bacterium]